VLVEAFNKILISKIELHEFNRRIDFFEEKVDLLPDEEAKHYGQNAIHLL
jgi:tetrahydromethanopterin S-methyltransferase subunit G